MLAARAFVTARRTATTVPDYPGTLPQSFAEAYAIQSRAIDLFDEPIGGWKVGRVHEPQASQLGTTRLAGPIFASSIVHATAGTMIEMPVFADGFAAVEAEMLLRVTQVSDNPAALDDAAILDLIDAVHVGIEVASSPFAGINALGPLVTASDFGNNAGLVVGPALPDWRHRDLSRLHAAMSINGVDQGEGDMTSLPGGPIESVRFLLGNLAERGIGGGGPFWVSAGAISGVHVIKPCSEAAACFDGQWTVRCRTRAATPTTKTTG
ncbi:2-keto-4-pentenoate hydratase [Sphingomonas lacunae]|uniref:2-keto-4-pentenoate hydratase n=1 Tax=Sphingomonas lacunae TaxID=2698828 RepID=A0A6M4AWE2_9SPHN|nr:2-keto-4-pentenoate hydratase [Sphingomonas lacunae]